MRNLTLVLFLFSLSVFAQSSHELTPAEKLQTALRNQKAEANLGQQGLRQGFGPRPERPYAEYEKARFVLFNDHDAFEAGDIKEAIAKNLPSDVSLILMSPSAWEANISKRFYGQFLPEERLKVIVAPKGNTFWARDTSPVPVFMKDGGLGLVETQHRGGKWIAQKILSLLPVPFIESEFDYPGGNFMADTRGNCFQVKSDRGYLSAAALSELYGCRKTTTFPYRHGLGDIDEVVKVLSDKIALNDEPSYQATLESLGYQVVSLPRPSGHKMGTYVNSLLVNGTVFLPVYGVKEDAQAIAVYESFGLKVTPLRSDDLSDEGRGSIHCITMSYP